MYNTFLMRLEEAAKSLSLLEALNLPKPEQADMIMYLLSRGLDPNVTDDEGNTFLREVSQQCPQLVPKVAMTLLSQDEEVFISNVSKDMSLMSCMKVICRSSNRVSLLKKLLSKGLDPSAGDENGTTPLMFAANKALPSMLQELLRHGADPLKKNGQGTTALELVPYSLKGEECGDILRRKISDIKLLGEDKGKD